MDIDLIDKFENVRNTLGFMPLDLDMNMFQPHWDSMLDRYVWLNVFLVVKQKIINNHEK